MTGEDFVLKSAKIEPVGTMHYVDVWNELSLLPTKTQVRVKILAHMMTLAFHPELRDVLSRCHQGTVSSDPRVQKSPMCFLDIHYIMSKHPSKTCRCVYPLYSFKDFVYYPPKPKPTPNPTLLPSPSSLSSSWWSRKYQAHLKTAQKIPYNVIITNILPKCREVSHVPGLS